MYQHYLRKALLLLLSVSLLSFLLSFFTGVSFLHSYSYYFSTFHLLAFLTQTFERKYMFIVCNGILIFLAGKSSSSSAMEDEPDHHIHGEITDIKEELMLQPAAPLYEEATMTSIGDELFENRAEEDAPEDPVLNEADNHAEDSTDEILDEEIETENEKESGPFLGEEEDDGESEEPASNTEELNKKIEEFIRKMKEELKLEAQQQHLIPA